MISSTLSPIIQQVKPINDKLASKDPPPCVVQSLAAILIWKCCQGICCLDKCHHDGWHQLEMVPGTYILSLVKIRSGTAEIFLIWTNVARTNVAWTNVNMTVGIFSRCSQEPTFKVSSKSVQ